MPLAAKYTRKTTTKPKGTLGRAAVDQPLLGGSAHCTIELTTPRARPTTTATPRFRSFAATTAARTYSLGSSTFTMGAARIPARPARKKLAAQTPSDTLAGLSPDSEVIAGESTMARTRRPARSEERR